MDVNKASFIKSTILGLLGGGAISSLYAMNRAKEDEKEERELASGSGKNQITVPLSRKRFMKAVSGSRQKGTGSDDAKKKPDVSSMSQADLASLKRQLLKRSECPPVSIGDRQGPVRTTSAVRKNAKSATMQLRDQSGRFSSGGELGKQAGVWNDAKGTIGDTIGYTGGLLVGAAAVKKLADRIAVNKKKRQVEISRRKYIDMVNNEVNDVDEPYYTSKTAQDRSLAGQALGAAGLAGIGTAAITGLVVYRIMENRRKALEDKADKDYSKYPANKTVTFKFAEDGQEDRGFFG